MRVVTAHATRGENDSGKKKAAITRGLSVFTK